jgi:hypothetical protein
VLGDGWVWPIAHDALVAYSPHLSQLQLNGYQSPALPIGCLPAHLTSPVQGPGFTAWDVFFWRDTPDWYNKTFLSAAFMLCFSVVRQYMERCAGWLPLVCSAPHFQVLKRVALPP